MNDFEKIAIIPECNINNEGLTGAYKKLGEKRSAVFFLNKGYLLSHYRFPTIKMKFELPMLNTFNLNLCGGWFLNDMGANEVHEQVLSRVINGFKPMGDIVDINENITKISVNARKENLKFKISSHSWENRKTIRFCKKGKFNELFDIESLYEDYLSYYLIINKETEGEYLEFFRKMDGRRLEDFLDFEIANPDSDSDAMLTGLILGYPIWSTVSILWGSG
ncbi:hypothetical protein LCGC14_1369800 [marine sediment metagenome]|uniref:Uncharacterized protein n=1 Tax=marine sediment metagenome TaxID=412755 RepID=A0A0F9K5T7_9ZZZZ